MRIRITLRAAVAAVLAAGALACLVPSAALADDPGRAFFGMQSWSWPDPDDLALMNRAGVGMTRVLFAGDLGNKRHNTHWAPYDAMMTSAARERIEILPTLLGISRGRPHRPHTPAGLRKWSEFVNDVAERYGRGGAFWEANPDLEPMPLTAYQVWNEPNLPAYWRPKPNAASYVKLVRLTRERLRAVDPGVSIVLAGLPDSRLGVPAIEFVRAIYAQPGARTEFDVVALHPYSKSSEGVMGAMNRTRALMNRRGDRSTAIWITELGWATGGPRSPFRTTRAGQAARIRATLTALIAARERLRLERVTLFGLQDRALGATEKPWWGTRVGLFGIDGRPKPAWDAFLDFTGGERGGRVRSLAARRADPTL